MLYTLTYDCQLYQLNYIASRRINHIAEQICTLNLTRSVWLGGWRDSSDLKKHNVSPLRKTSTQSSVHYDTEHTSWQASLNLASVNTQLCRMRHVTDWSDTIDIGTYTFINVMGPCKLTIYWLCRCTLQRYILRVTRWQIVEVKFRGKFLRYTPQIHSQSTQRVAEESLRTERLVL